jgi:FHS family L-fucose permease-like MFS transporter
MHTNRTFRPLLYTVYFIYFFNGLSLCFEGAFNPEFKEIFNLGYTQLMLTLFAKNLPFVVFSLAIGYLAQRLGFKTCLTIAMFLFAGGTLLLIPGLISRQYGIVLAGFFIIGTGFNFQLVAGNPLLSGLGEPEGSSSRLNFGNALGAVAQIIAPLIISVVVPAAVVSAVGKIPYITVIFITIGIVLIATAIITLFMKGVEVTTTQDHSQFTQNDGNTRDLFRNHKLILGFFAIFLVIGVEAGIFGLFRNYLEDPAVAGLTAVQSQRLFTVYFAVFALGRLVGSFVQKKINAALSLVIHVIAAIICILITVSSSGTPAVIFLILTGFFISIFFPTLYALSIRGMGRATARASGLLTMGMLGAAVIPLGQGKIADVWGLHISFILAVVPYVFVLLAATKLREN